MPKSEHRPRHLENRARDLTPHSKPGETKKTLQEYSGYTDYRTHYSISRLIKPRSGRPRISRSLVRTFSERVKRAEKLLAHVEGEDIRENSFLSHTDEDLFLKKKELTKEKR